jgi:hypothetical protein
MALASQVREEFWQFRTELDPSQLKGRIYLITKGRVREGGKEVILEGM